MNQATKNRLSVTARKVLVAIGCNHIAAVVLLKAYRSASPLGRKTRWLLELRRFLDRAPGHLFRAAGYVDDKRPCPNCGKPEAVVHLEKLKTYCWDCSYWGHDPSLEPKE